MSIWSRLIRIKKAEDKNSVTTNENKSVSLNASNYTIIDVEIGLSDRKIHDIGALRHNGEIFHKTSKKDYLIFLVTQTISAVITSFIMTPNTYLPIKSVNGL